MIRCIVKDDVVHYNPANDQQAQEESQGSNHTDGGPRSPPQRQGGELFIDLGAPSYSSNYPEPYSEGHLTGRQINFSADLGNISSKEPMENSAYHPTSSTASRATKRKSMQSNRKLEPSVKEEVSGGSQSSSVRPQTRPMMRVVG